MGKRAKFAEAEACIAEEAIMMEIHSICKIFDCSMCSEHEF
jgi:hypothetical protein